MKIEFPRAIAITVIEPYRLRIQWSTGETLEVDLTQRLRKNRALKHLLDPKLFVKAHISDHGTSIEWVDSELGADNVYAWTREQMGEPSHEMFFGWMYRHGLNLDSVAEILGMSRRMIAYYRSGQKPIPKHIWLACQGWQCLQKDSRKRAKAA